MRMLIRLNSRHSANGSQIPSKDDTWMPHHYPNRRNEQQRRALASPSNRHTILRQTQRLIYDTLYKICKIVL
jgi:hypothetical protein